MNNGYAVTQFYHGDCAKDTDMFVGGSQDNGTSRVLAADTPEAWRMIYGGDGGYVAIDPTNSQRLFIEIQGFPQIFLSEDGGETFAEATNGITDTDGVFDSNPKLNPDAVVLKEIAEIDKQLLKTARGKGSIYSSGGMESKLKAAEIATRGGVGVVIANGKKFNLSELLEGNEIGSYCVPSGKRIRGRKKWIAFSQKVEGKIYIDSGGENALVREKKSLLPAGVKEVKGQFEVGGNISICNEEDREIARGLTNFSSAELQLIMGLNTNKIAETLGVDTYFEEVVHRDNLVILE